MASLFRRACVLGFAVVALLTGLTATPTAAADGTLPAAPQTMDQLVRMPAGDLQALYMASPPASVPSGFTPGRAIKNPGSRSTVGNARRTRLVWQGKVFRDDGTMKNRMFGVAKAIPADVYMGNSLLDGQPSLIFDYSRSKLWPTVRDEVREVSPGLYLGIMYKNGAPSNPPMFFTLDSRK
jgi:hypothetical protein